MLATSRTIHGPVLAALVVVLAAVALLVQRSLRQKDRPEPSLSATMPDVLGAVERLGWHVDNQSRFGRRITRDGDNRVFESNDPAQWQGGIKLYIADEAGKVGRCVVFDLNAVLVVPDGIIVGDPEMMRELKAALR
jgi:hypothetical protein